MSENMIFCLGDGKYESKGDGYQKNNRIFNQPVTKEEFDEAINSCPTLEYNVKELSKMSDDFKKWVSELPHFNAKLFKKITGVKWEL